MPTPLQQYSSIVYDTAVGAGVPPVNAQILVDQARHESEDFTSHVFLANNNAFGLKVPSVRKSPYILKAGTAAPSNEGSTPYAAYASLQDCVMDLLNWLEYNHVNWNEVADTDSYAAWIKSKGYYGDTESNYAAALNRLDATFNEVYIAGIAKAKKLVKYWPIFAGVTLAGIGLYLILKDKETKV
jgi:flagellum-specific peptidoglycan hydrolase FlgJ